MEHVEHAVTHPKLAESARLRRRGHAARCCLEETTKRGKTFQVPAARKDQGIIASHLPHCLLHRPHPRQLG